MRRWIWIAIGLVIAVATAHALGDLRQLPAGLAGFRWSAFAAALGLALANYAIRFVRWEIYLRDRLRDRERARHEARDDAAVTSSSHDLSQPPPAAAPTAVGEVRVPLGSSALVFGAGLSLSITPGKVGELVKSYLLRELHDIPATRTAPIVVAERVSDLVALLILAIVGVAAYGMSSTLVIAAAVAVASGLVLLAWPRPTRLLIEIATRPARLRRFRAPVHDMYGGLASLCRPTLLTTATGLAVPAWACECIGFALIVNAFPGAHVDLGPAMAIYAITTIAGALSFLPGGLGVTEGAMTILLVRGSAGLARSVAFDATLLTRLATLWFAVALGVGCLALARRRVRARARVTAPA